MMTMVKIAAGRAAWKYFMDKVSDDASATRGKAASYYIKGGNPPGRWYGTGLTGVGLGAGDVVSGAHLERLFGSGSHPLTGERLARPFVEQVPLTERIEARVSTLPAGQSTTERETAIATIVEEEAARKQVGSVAGFEAVFNPMKSVSTWWAMADAGQKDLILAAHHQAVNDTLAALERDAARTRTGTDGAVQEHVQGIIGAGFDHWETREGDPQLHTHVLISNRVQGLDGKWRTLDSQHSLMPAIVTLSEQYDANLMDQLSIRFGIRWTEQSISADPDAYQAWLKETGERDTQNARAFYAEDVCGVERKNQKWEIEGVPQELIDQFSTRAKQVRVAKDELIRRYVETHGRQPDRYRVLRMRATAALQSRRAKQHHTLRGLTKQWRHVAAPLVGDTFRFAERITAAGEKRLQALGRWSFRADDVTDAHIEASAAEVLTALGRDRATWSVHNARAATIRATKPWTFRSAADRQGATERILEQVIAQAIPLTPKNELHVPFRFQNPDGTSQFTASAKALYTTTAVFDAETRILAAADTVTAPTVDETIIEELIDTPCVYVSTHTLSDDQADAAAMIARSGRAIDLLVGPAGTGKTTTLEKLRELWETQHGAGTVRGLAPTAKAASVLAESLGIPTENTAKWIHETTKKATHTIDFHLRAGDLLVVDEASIGGTMALDELRAQAERAGAKLLLVGDWAQLSAVDAGGAFGMLARYLDNPPELQELRRFSNNWEKATSVLLRLGRTSALRDYQEHGRVSWGLLDTLIHEAVDAWKQDESTGNTSLLIAPTNDVADHLNEVARAHRISTGHVTGPAIPIRTGSASVGDRIVARRNNRFLQSDAGNWVKNNSEWTITEIHDDGSVLAIRQDTDEPESVLLPARYVSKHVQLGYATTAHRSQGRTVDTSHTIARDGTTRENLYVAMTRGRHLNKVYVAIDPPETMEGWAGAGTERSYLEVLEGILATSGAELSAHDTLLAERDRLDSIAVLAAEYDTISQTALAPRFAALITNALPQDAAPTVPTESPAFGPLSAALRRAADDGHEIQTLLPSLVAAREMGSADDPVAILHFRLTQWARHQDAQTEPERICGLIPLTQRTGDTDLDRALTDRADAMRVRAESVLDTAIAAQEPWLEALPAPVLGREEAWRQAIITVAAYRDRHRVDDTTPLGVSDGLNSARRAEYDRAEASIATLGAPAATTQPTLPATQHRAELLTPVMQPARSI